MSSSRYTLSLSRAHSIAKRATALASAREGDILKALGGTQLTAVPTADQRKVLEARGEAALADIDFVVRALRTGGSIRRAVAIVNAEKGISPRLAEVAASRLVSSLYARIMSTDIASLPSIDQLQEILDQRKGATAGYGDTRSVRVSLVRPDALEPLRNRKSAIDAAVMAESDEINDLNRATVTVEIDDDIAANLGLAKE